MKLSLPLAVVLALLANLIPGGKQVANPAPASDDSTPQTSK